VDRPDDAATATSICVGCGLCCDGTLFSHLGVLDESDLGAPLRALGVEVVTEAEPPVFALPCPAVEHGTCTIYHLQRPRACGWFECDLSTAVLEGRTDEQAARATIQATLELRAAVSAGRAPRSALTAQVRAHFRAEPDA
jgi:Fe-S-cluster containining protein